MITKSTYLNSLHILLLLRYLLLLCFLFYCAYKYGKDRKAQGIHIQNINKCNDN